MNTVDVFRAFQLTSLASERLEIDQSLVIMLSHIEFSTNYDQVPTREIVTSFWNLYWRVEVNNSVFFIRFGYFLLLIITAHLVYAGSA